MGQYLNDDGTDRDLEKIDNLLCKSPFREEEIRRAAMELLGEVDRLRNKIRSIGVVPPRRRK